MTIKEEGKGMKKEKDYDKIWRRNNVIIFILLGVLVTLTLVEVVLTCLLAAS